MRRLVGHFIEFRRHEEPSDEDEWEFDTPQIYRYGLQGNLLATGRVKSTEITAGQGEPYFAKRDNLGRVSRVMFPDSESASHAMESVAGALAFSAHRLSDDVARTVAGHAIIPPASASAGSNGRVRVDINPVRACRETGQALYVRGDPGK